MVDGRLLDYISLVIARLKSPSGKCIVFGDLLQLPLVEGIEVF